MLNLLEYTLLSLRRRWRKQVALVLIYTLVVGFYASIIFFTDSLQSETESVLHYTPELWVQKIAGGRLEPMPQAFADSLRGIRGVRRVVPRIWGYYYDSPTGAVFTLQGSDTLLTGLKMLNTTQKSALKPDEALVGTGFLELRGLQLGESLTLFDNKGSILSFKIVGAFTAESDLLTRDLIILHPTAARRMLGLQPTHITDVALEIHNPQEVNNIGRKTDQRFGGIRVVTSEQLRATYQTLFGWRGGILVYGSLMSLLAFLLLAWERAAGLSEEERKELGILKAVGWQIGDVLQFKFWEAMIISFTATLLGVLCAYWHVFGLGAPLFKPFLIGWSVLYPAYQLQPLLRLESIVLIFALSVIPYLTATLIPAWRGAVIEPAEAMK
jgi:ABC-type lipoprotein release transport system permease subunit